MGDIVVKGFTFAISSPDVCLVKPCRRLFPLCLRPMNVIWPL